MEMKRMKEIDKKLFKVSDMNLTMKLGTLKHSSTTK